MVVYQNLEVNLFVRADDELIISVHYQKWWERSIIQQLAVFGINLIIIVLWKLFSVVSTQKLHLHTRQHEFYWKRNSEWLFIGQKLHNNLWDYCNPPSRIRPHRWWKAGLIRRSTSRQEQLFYRPHQHQTQQSREKDWNIIYMVWNGGGGATGQRQGGGRSYRAASMESHPGFPENWDLNFNRLRPWSESKRERRKHCFCHRKWTSPQNDSFLSDRRFNVLLSFQT